MIRILVAEDFPIHSRITDLHSQYGPRIESCGDSGKWEGGSGCRNESEAGYRYHGYPYAYNGWL